MTDSSTAIGSVVPIWGSGSLLPGLSLAGGVVGGSYVSVPTFTVPIAAPGVYVPLAPAAGTPWSLDGDSVGFALASAANGQLQYTSAVARPVLITGSLTMTKAGGTKQARFAVFINGVIHAPSLSICDVTNRITTQVVAASIHNAVAGMTFDIRVQNFDDADDFIVETATLSISAAGGS